MNLVILTEYLACTVIVVSSNPPADPSPRTIISSFLLSVCSDKLLSTLKIVTFLPYLSFTEKFKLVLNLIP